MPKKDLVLSIIIGEIAAWLLLIVAVGVLPGAMYQKFQFFIKTLPVYFPIICAICLYIAYLISQKIAVIYEAAKFILIGGLNTLIDWGILALMIILFRKYLVIEASDIWFVLPFITVAYYSFFKTISFIVALVNSYIWNKFWTFKKTTTESVSREFLQFMFVSLIGFLLNVIIASGIFKLIAPIGPLTSDQWAILAAVAATFVSMFWNFIGYKFIVFNK